MKKKIQFEPGITFWNGDLNDRFWHITTQHSIYALSGSKITYCSFLSNPKEDDICPECLKKYKETL